MLEQASEQLHGHILERERRSMKQFEQKRAGSELPDGPDRGVAKGPVGFAREPRQIRFGYGVADKGTDHLNGRFGIGPAGKSGNFLRCQSRPCLGHIEATVAGEAGERNIDEAKRRGLATGGNVAHD